MKISVRQTICYRNMGESLQDFDMILVMVRNPYDHMVSRFHYLRDIRTQVRGEEAHYARHGNFEDFVLKPKLTYPIEPYLLLEGTKPPNLHVHKYEELSSLNALLTPFLRSPLDLSKKVNASSHDHFSNFITPTINEAVFRKFQILFEMGYYEKTPTL